MLLPAQHLGESRYSRGREAAADGKALDILQCRYGHAGGATEFFETLQRTEDDVAAFTHYLASHPSMGARIDALPGWVGNLLDRFGLNVALSGHTAPTERGQIIRRRLDFDSDPQAFCAQWEAQQQALRERCEQARILLASIALDDDALASITERCFAAGVDGLRADLVWLRAARAHAAWRGAEAIAEQDIDAVAEFALRHRRKESSSSSPQPPAQTSANTQIDPSEGQGQWGDMPAPALATGARREVPSWPKK